jgi:hypothetical protein
MRIEEIATLLDKKDLPGSPEELAILGTRIEELIGLNGRQWVINHRRKLIREWAVIIERAVIRQP